MWNLYDFARDMTKKPSKACRMLLKKLFMAMTYILENLALSHNAIEWEAIGTMTISGLSDIFNRKINRKPFKHKE